MINHVFFRTTQHARLKAMINGIDAKQDSIANEIFVAGTTITYKFEGFFVMIALNPMDKMGKLEH